jgi:hypothetical protein
VVHTTDGLVLRAVSSARLAVVVPAHVFGYVLMWVGGMGTLGVSNSIAVLAPWWFWWTWCVLTTELVLDRQGLTLYSGLGRVRAAWDQVELLQLSPRVPHFALVLRGRHLFHASVPQWWQWSSNGTSRRAVEEGLRFVAEVTEGTDVIFGSEDGRSHRVSPGPRRLIRWSLRRPTIGAWIACFIAPLAFGSLVVALASSR